MKSILSILFVLFIWGCKPSNEVFVSSFITMPLRFSTDTILFDTLIVSNKISITKRLLVYNSSSFAVNIDNICIGNIQSSPFSLIVNGELGTTFSNIELIGGDSLLILVNVVVAPNNSNPLFVISDSINFQIQNFESKVVLNTWGQDAYFYNNDTISNNTFFANDKPHVIYNNLIVDSLSKLTISKGAKLLFYNGASIVVNGEINAIGDKSNMIQFVAYRSDGQYKKLPGQWAGININSSYSNNIFSWVKILNAQNAINCNKNTTARCIIDHSLIAYVSESGINSYKGNFDISNSIFYASMRSLISIFGGTVNLINCSLDNYSSGLGGAAPAFIVNDSFSSLNFKILNNVIWGNLTSEFDLTISNINSVNLGTRKNIFKNTKLNDYLDNQYFSNSNSFKFKNPSEFDFKPDTISRSPLLLSPAIDNGEFITVTDDFNGNLRDLKPDIGAVEFVAK